MALFLLADEGLGISQAQALYGAIATIAVGLLAFAGVVFTAVWQRRTTNRAAETERKISTFEEQDRMLERSRQETDRAVDAELRAVRERDEWRRRALVAEDKVDKWIEGRR